MLGHAQKIESLIKELQAEKNASNEFKGKLNELSAELDKLSPYRSLTKSIDVSHGMGLAYAGMLGLAEANKYMGTCSMRLMRYLKQCRLCMEPGIKKLSEYRIS